VEKVLPIPAVPTTATRKPFPFVFPLSLIAIVILHVHFLLLRLLSIAFMTHISLVLLCHRPNLDQIQLILVPKPFGYQQIPILRES
jgi:hypothetical protein